MKIGRIDKIILTHLEISIKKNKLARDEVLNFHTSAELLLIKYPQSTRVISINKAISKLVLKNQLKTECFSIQSLNNT